MPWIKAQAVTPAVHATDADVIVIADVWADNVTQAVDAVAAGARWAIRHLLVHRLTEAATTRV